MLAEECSFGTLTNRLIRDKLVFVTKGRVQDRFVKSLSHKGVLRIDNSRPLFGYSQYIDNDNDKITYRTYMFCRLSYHISEEWLYFSLSKYITHFIKNCT